MPGPIDELLARVSALEASVKTILEDHSRICGEHKWLYDYVIRMSDKLHNEKNTGG